MEEKLIWKEESRKIVLNTPVFSVTERICRSPQGIQKTYTVLDTAEWAMVIPLIKTTDGEKFVMVKQWRHGAREISLEFPGGVTEKGEAPEKAAFRELKEETGYTAGKIEKLGEFNPNPAIMSNKIHFFLAQDLEGPDKQELDPDEFVEVLLIPKDEVIKNISKPPYIHALVAAALCLYMNQSTN